MQVDQYIRTKEYVGGLNFMIPQEVRIKALNYELEYLKAYGADVKDYGDFIHIKNKFVNYAGDFNRAIHIKLKSPDDFDRVRH